MKWTTSLCLFLSLTFLIGCSSPLPTADPCAWTSRIDFQQETKSWLQDLDWPQTAYEDFEKVSRHNDKIEMFCNH